MCGPAVAALPVGYTFVASRKGKRQLYVEGYLFGCKEQRGERTYWTCTEYYKSGCPGRCVTFRGALKVTGGQHNHPAPAHGWPQDAALTAAAFADMATPMEAAASLQ